MATLASSTVAMQTRQACKATLSGGHSKQLRSRMAGKLSSRRSVQCAFWGRKKEEAKADAGPQEAGGCTKRNGQRNRALETALKALSLARRGLRHYYRRRPGLRT